jgi:hypothetical protein
MKQRVFTGLLAAATMAGTVVLGPGVASASGGWVIQSTYAPPPSQANKKDIGLDEVSCSASDACVTVGHAGSHQFLSESWNGTTWSPLLTPWPAGGGELSGVSCSAASACSAVGFTSLPSNASVPLVERWNGSSWHQQTVSGPVGGGFSEVSCPAAQFCVAVGNTNTGTDTTATLAEAWNGTRWAVQPTPPAGQHAGLASVSCPTPSDCVAVGYNGTLSSANVLIERWNGTSWALQKSPHVPRKDAPFLTTVSCATASSCTALGGYQTSTGSQGLAEHWNGTTWARQHLPRAAAVGPVSCPSATSCTAIGTTVAAHWNGTAWTVQRTARPPHSLGGQDLQALSCPTVSVCEAVGFFQVRPKTGRFRDKTLIEAN